MSALRGNCVIGQSGGPTAVINASVCGIAQAALSRGDIFSGVYGAYNGILGVLNEELFDLGQESPAVLEGLKYTPAAAMGSCRHKLKDPAKDRTDYQRILDVFKAHGIRYFFYIGGNDSMDTADKVGRLAAELGYDLVAIGVPKTIDNDLAETDHCPGYGSVAKYVATAVMEAGRDTEALYTANPCNVIEVMGRNAGWIAAATGVARREPQDAPHLIYMPEKPFFAEQFVSDVQECLKQFGRCDIAVGEGIRDEAGRFIAEMGGNFGKDSFGHTQLGGVGEALQRIVEAEVGVKCRTNKLGLCQRSAMHFASLTDRDEAYLCGQKAVEAAIAGENRKMVTLIRSEQPDRGYACRTGLVDLAKVANGEKMLPAEYINAAGNGVTPALREFVAPLMRGEVSVPIGSDGLPMYVRLTRRMLQPKLPARAARKS